MLAAASTPVLGQARLTLVAQNAELEAIEVSPEAKVLDPTWIADAEKRKGTLAVSLPAPEAWQDCTVRFKATNDASVKFRLSGEFSKQGEKWVYIDNIRVEGATIRNPDFEEVGGGKVAGWNMPKGEGGAAGESVNEADGASSGDRFLKLSFNNPAIQTIQVPKDGEVKVTFAVRAAPGS